jgi:hypothetical protein
VSSEVLHVPREKLGRETLNLHHAITSQMEEFEAVDWYRQRADDCDDTSLRAAHRPRGTAAMALAWIRRNDREAEAQLREYLFTDGSITGREEDARLDHGR